MAQTDRQKAAPAGFGAAEVYWRDIQRYRPLSRSEETEMVRRARAGDESAMHVPGVVPSCRSWTRTSRPGG